MLRQSYSGLLTAELYLDGGLSGRRLSIAPGQVLAFDILVVVHAESGESAGWSVQGVIENDGGITTLFGGPLMATYLGGDASTSTWKVSVSARDTATDDALSIAVNGGVADKEVRWVATVRTAEVVGP